MPFKFNPITGQLDLVNVTSSGSGNVTGIPPTTVRAIARWADTTGTTIQDSKAVVQDGGAIEAQAFITRTAVTDDVTVHSGEAWISPAIEMTLTGSVVLEADSELIIV